MQFRCVNNIYHYLKTSSTQERAWELASSGAPSGTLVIARVQERGRGRYGRKWYSPAGGLWFSLLYFPVEAVDAGKVIHSAAMALKRSLKEVVGVRVKIKLPNDLYYQKKKVAGIILEKKAEKVVLGVGVNLNFRRDAIPGGFPAITIKEITGHRVSRAAILSSFLTNFCRKETSSEF